MKDIFKPLQRKKNLNKTNPSKLERLTILLCWKTQHVLDVNTPEVNLSVQICSVSQSCPTLWNSMECNMPSLPVHHQLPEFTQTHVHWVGDAIQPSHPLSSHSPSAFSLPQLIYRSKEIKKLILRFICE